MNRIYKNNDLIFNLTFNNLPIDLDAIDNIELKFYTINENNYIVKGINDIDDKEQLVLEWKELRNLEEGVLNFHCTLSFKDDKLNDGSYDKGIRRMTNYYIVSGVENINIDGVDATNYYTKEEVNELLDGVVAGELDLTGYYTKEDVDYMLSSYVEKDALGSYYTKSEVNDLIDRIDIPVTDLSNYYKKAETYSKSEVNQLIDGLSTGDGEINLTNYYTKSEVDAKIPKNYITSIPSEYVTELELSSTLTGYSKTNHTHNYLTSIPSEYITESELSAKGYLTQHQSLTNYYTKGEVDTKLRGYSTSGHTHSQYLTEHQSLSGYAKLTDIPTDYITESKLNAKGYLTAVPSEYVTETELESKGYLTAVPSQYVTEAELEAKDYISVIPSEYITETELERKGYLTEHQPLTNYYTKNEVNNLIDGLSTSGGEVNLTNYYTKSEVDAKIPKNYLTSIPSEYVTETELSDYYTKEEVNNKITESGNFDSTQYYTKSEVDAKIPTDYLTSIPSEYVTESELNAKGYLTQHQSLSNYYTKSEVNTLIDNIEIPTGSTNVNLNDYYTKSEIDEVMLSNHLSDISFYDGKLIGVNINGNTRNEIEVATINGERILGVNKDITIPIVNTSDYYTKSEVNTLIDNIDIPNGETNVDLSNYYTKSEIDEKIPTDYIKAVNIGRNDDENFQVEDGVVNLYTEFYNGSYDMNIDSRSVFGLKPIDDTITLESAGGTGNGNFRAGIKVGDNVINRISALESELTGVSELITKLNDMIV